MNRWREGGNERGKSERGGKEEGMCRKEKEKCMGEWKKIRGQSAGEIQRLTDS